MSYKCKKCKKTFISFYMLNVHENKKISCDVILKCDKCDKIFKREIDLINHKNRKTSCAVAKSERNELESKNLVKIKLDAKLAVLKQQSKIQKERANERIEIFKAKSELALKLANLKIENDNKKSEERKILAMEMENEKTKRKEITASINKEKAFIEQTRLIQDELDTYKNRINKEEERYSKNIKYIQSINTSPFIFEEDQVQIHLDRISYDGINNFDKTKLFEDYENPNQFEISVFKLLFNNPNHQENRNIAYKQFTNEHEVIISDKLTHKISYIKIAMSLHLLLARIYEIIYFHMRNNIKKNILNPSRSDLKCKMMYSFGEAHNICSRFIEVLDESNITEISDTLEIKCFENNYKNIHAGSKIREDISSEIIKYAKPEDDIELSNNNLSFIFHITRSTMKNFNEVVKI